MRAEVIAIGDELTSGQRLDTNSQWLSQQLGDIGIRTMFHTTVADDLESNRQAFRQAAARVDVVICTGGLGPTADDLTRQAIAEAFELPLILDESALARIRQMFESRGREMPERNRVQALFPAGSDPIRNPHGTAPGIDLTLDIEGRRCRIFSLPGVPAEMKEMWAETVRPALRESLGDAIGVLRHFELKCFGTGESALESMLPDLIRRGREPSVGITVSKATITLRITGHGESDKAFQDLIQPTVDTIRQNLGDLVFGEGSDELHHAVARLLSARQQTVAVAECGTGGLISDWLASLPDSKRFFRGGFVLPDRESARHVLGVDAAVDPPTHATNLAVAIKQHCESDFGLSIGEFPANQKDADAKVFIGFASDQVASVAGRRFAGHPEILKERAAKQVLDVLRLHLLGNPG